MATLVDDTFTDTDGMPVTDHTPTPTGGAWFLAPQYDFDGDTPSIYNNAIDGIGAYPYQGVFSSTLAANGDYTLELTGNIDEAGGYHTVQLLARCPNALTPQGDEEFKGYVVEFGYAIGYGWRILLYNPGDGFAELGSYVPTVSPFSTHTLRFELAGSSLIVKLDGTTVISVTDTVYATAGHFGWLAWSQSITQFTATGEPAPEVPGTFWQHFKGTLEIA